MRVRMWVFVMAPAVLVVLAACGGDSDETSAGRADCEQGAQVVEIQAVDTPAFDPSSVTVSAGEPVCFVVTNAGETDHEFVVGDKMMQDEHEQAMASDGEMGGDMEMGDMPELGLAPGETKSVTTTFDEAGTTMYACHEPGHYQAGMIGTITIA